MPKQQTYKRVVRTPEIPKEWQELFLSVADLCDGGWNVDLDKKFVTESYKAILKTHVGLKIYTEAMENNPYRKIV